MKHLKITLVLLTLCFNSHADAQIFKKLGEKISKVAEKTIEKKNEEKTEKDPSKASDSTFNNSKENKKEKNNPFNISVSKAAPARNYNFSHKYTMQIQSDKRTTDINYYLTNSGNYIASTIPDKKGRTDVITVMDLSRETIFMFMENKGDKTLMSMNLNLEETTEDAIEETDVSITPTGNKKPILGYSCEEFKVVGKDLNGSVWVTQNAGISFSKSFYNIKAKKGANQSWMKMLNGLTMEMDMVDTSKRKPQRTVMTCIALDKVTLNIDTDNYKKLM
ncbi:DUF4412 domain-containing protein [Lacinutrix sp. Hel_I_90]|uniref:DUF4412 domain-containing protein n=1 Tax=Lacinutrix sp. Hel_I_90 TaxID=1249999 RepID=UPI0005C868F3|nr:DUF4412 domain-containing protein [Lacinutrix sp. Hel_I_90]